MKLEFSDEVIKILDYLCDKLGIVIDWTSQNVVPYLGQLIDKFIKWQVSTSVVWIVLAILAAIFGSIVVIVLNKYSWMEDETRGILIMILVGCAIIIIGKQVFDIVECYTFPEKAIYDYIEWKKMWN